MLTSRRLFVTGLTSTLVAAPALVRATSLMDIKGYIMDPKSLAWRYHYPDGRISDWVESYYALKPGCPMGMQGNRAGLGGGSPAWAGLQSGHEELAPGRLVYYINSEYRAVRMSDIKDRYRTKVGIKMDPPYIVSDTGRAVRGEINANLS